MELVAIGTVESPLTDRAAAPKQGDEGAPESWLVFDERFADALDGIAAGGRVFIGSNNGVIARDATTGADLWIHRSPDASYIPQNATASAPAVLGDTLYMGFPNGRVTALNVATGAVVWSVRLPGRLYAGGVLSPAAVSGDTVYVGSNNGFLYGLDRRTGAQVLSFEIGTWVASGPAISGNALLAGAWDGNLYAFAGRLGD